MNSKTLIIITIVFLTTLATAKPLVKQDAPTELHKLIKRATNAEESSSETMSKSSSPSQLHKLIKRSANGKESTSKTGFAAVTTTTQSKNRQKRRVCKEWAKQEITGQWKCIDFLEKEVK